VKSCSTEDAELDVAKEDISAASPMTRPIPIMTLPEKRYDLSFRVESLSLERLESCHESGGSNQKYLYYII
jgi:hypothetical protein